MKNKILLFFSLIILSGCSEQIIKMEKNFSKLDHINKYQTDFSQEKKNVLIAVKKFSPEECEEIFNVNVVKCGYQPIQITINNFSTEVLHLSPTNIGLRLVSPERVAKSCHWRTGEIATAAGALSYFFFWPALIPTAYCGMEMQKSNEKISKSIVKQDMVQCWDNVSILPSEIVSRIIFVEREDLRRSFLISVFSAKDKNIEFSVTLDI
ncbi:MAG: hypothetical protein P4L22_06465 [Candidatus Babeliales bacterium]|nr:hypothetical protein [Candidatus Babeliales bacterium]